jgi:hypothetical protein
MYRPSDNPARQSSRIAHILEQSRESYASSHTSLIDFNWVLIFIMGFAVNNYIPDVVLNPGKDHAVAIEMTPPEGFG